jgi:hypothetical protein
MRGLDPPRPGQIGNRPRDLEHPVVGPRRQVELRKLLSPPGEGVNSTLSGAEKIAFRGLA